MTYLKTDAPTFRHLPERILQFGEGNFLRAFVDWMIQSLNEGGDYQGSIVLCQPIAAGLSAQINEQEGAYHVAMRGMERGQPVERIEKITSVSRCINPYEDYQSLLQVARSPDLQVVVSNTTEAGICYDAGARWDQGVPSSFPAKIAALLYERFRAFGADHSKGLLFLPVELIDNNGAELKRHVLRHTADWGLGEEFTRWIVEANHFANTLVDRIVTGYPREELAHFETLLGMEDRLLVTCELFNLWVIEADPSWRKVLPLDKGAGNVIWTDDVSAYKKRKVRLLNGAHTATVLAAYLAGHNVVLDIMHDQVFRDFLEGLMRDEVLPTLDLPHQELVDFAQAVSARFANPYIRHKLLDISLNSCSKFETRCLPSLLEYQQRQGQLPRRLTFALAAFLAFYRVEQTPESYVGIRGDDQHYPVRDDPSVLAFFASLWQGGDCRAVAQGALSNTALWRGRDLSQVPGLVAAVTAQLEQLERLGVRAALEGCLDSQP